MDLQGKPIGNTQSGTKNTSTPADPVQEGPGAIAKDSLAAESSAIDDQYTSGVTGSSSTFNNTDTSGATTLPPANRAEDRLSAEENDGNKGASGKKYPEALGDAKFTGQHSDHGYSGGPSSDSTSSGGSGVYKTALSSGGSTGPSGSTESTGSRHADPAPSYVSFPQQDGKPKGSNIKEGGFDTDAPNASFTADIGSSDDPGREGISHFQRQSAGDAADSGLPKTQKNLDTEHTYQKLGSDEAA